MPDSNQQSDLVTVRNGLTHSGKPAREAFERLIEQLETYREFYAAWWEVEKGIADFDLHSEAVTRLSEAHAAVIQRDSNPVFKSASGESLPDGATRVPVGGTPAQDSASNPAKLGASTDREAVVASPEESDEPDDVAPRPQPRPKPERPKPRGASSPASRQG